ncbi:MAG: Gx transporter family protein [Clostridia bacterium]|nr:Gx transporter family protein [Clostridia bacterium]MDE7265632.1 Gx transporter family protein [Clostridia bacterium]
MKNGQSAAKKIATLAIFTALSLIAFIIENQFPPMFFPGARMGLANIFSFAALIMYSPWEAFVIIAIRTGLGAVYAGNLSALLYSFTGGVVSMAVSSVLIYAVYPRVSVLSVSIAAAVAHNITQNIVFVILSGTTLTFGYMPYLILLGILSGAIVGGVIMLIFKKVPMSVFERAIYKKNKKV